MSDTQVVKNEYNQVMLGILIILVAYIFTMYAITLKTRIQTFNGKHMKKFTDIHKKEIKQDRAPEFGYPDCGSGRYSQELSYKDWFYLNCSQRAQLNFLE